MLADPDLRASFDAIRGRLRADLARLVAIPSVAFEGHPHEPLDAARDLVAELLREAGLDDVWTIPMAEGSGAAVAAERPGPPGAPTVLLYAHYDVQPVDAADWSSPPFELTERDGRLYGRGAADDKSGVAAHVAALLAHGGAPPVNLKVLIEGGEENGREALTLHVGANPEWFADVDVFVIADAGPWHAGEPIVTTSLRGDCDLTVELRTIRSALHSGEFGGPLPDALTALSRLLATLHDEAGDVAVAGLDGGTWDGGQLDEAAFRASAGVLDGVQLIGSGTVADRLWTRFALSVVGIDAPSVLEARAAIVPHARAKLNLRIPPGADPAAARDALIAHLRAHAPWGAQLEIEAEPPADGIVMPAGGPAVRAALDAFAAAYGRPAATMGSGGSIPLTAALRAAAPGSEILVVGAQDADRANIHAPDESVAIAELERFALAEALLLAELGRVVGA